MFRLLTVAVFLFLAYVVVSNWREIRGYLGRIDYRFLGLSLLIHSATLGATALGWHLLTRQFMGKASLRRNLEIYYSTVIAKEVPGVIWYIAGRAHLYAREGINGSMVVTCSFMENVWFFVSGMTVYFLFSPLYRFSILGGKEPLLALLAIPLAVLAIRPGLLVRAVNVPLRKFKRQQISIFDRSPRWSLLIFLAYVAAWLLGSLVLYCIIVALHPLPATELPTVIGFLAISGLAGLLTSMLPAGMGIRELTLATLLSGYVGFPLAVVVSVLLRTVGVVDQLICGAITVTVRTKG
jgi:hypothetical protein